MAFSKNNTVAWSDVQALYNNLNAAKTYIGQTTVTVPENPGLTAPATVTSLKNSIESCRSNKYIGDIALTGVTVPSAGSYLYPDIFNRMNDTITAIRNTCLHDSANFTSNNSFGSFSCRGFGSFSMNMFHSRSGSCSQSTHNSF